MDEGSNDKQPMIQLSGLWKQESKAGKAYYSGNMGGIQLQLWPNKFKKKDDNRPDLILWVVKRKPKEESKTEEPESIKDPCGDEVPF